jgi:membrane-associated phospholipid phosphatase
MILRVDERVASAARGNGRLDHVMRLFSRAGDDGRVWIALTLIEARRRPKPATWAVSSLVCLGLESAIVNLGVKRLVRRPRPDHATLHHPTFRVPTDTSFPSGHAASAANMAVLLSDGGRLPAVWWTLAVGIGWSRVHLGVHHPSDVAAGLVVGSLFGVAGRVVNHRLGT